MSPSTNAKPKRNPRRAVKDRWEEEKLMTNPESQLVDLDLVKLLANPKAWDCLEESEKQEILNLLPDGTHPNPNPPDDDPDAKIPPIPEYFLRYSNNWRDGIRQFQDDLQHGRYDPVWQREAHQAMEERLAGKFDKFKEEEFEQFWGQKQRMDKSQVAGQSSQVRLKTLINQGVVRERDVWKYSRVFSKGHQKIHVEKEARIVKVNGARLNFIIPTGQRVFLSIPDVHKSEETADESQTDAVVVDGQDIDSAKIDSGAHQNMSETVEAGSSKKRKSELQHGDCKRQRSEPPETKNKADSSTEQSEHTPAVTVEIVNPPIARDTFPTEQSEHTPAVTVEIVNPPIAGGTTSTEQTEEANNVVVETNEANSPIVEETTSTDNSNSPAQPIEEAEKVDGASDNPSQQAPEPNQEPLETSELANTAEDIDDIGEILLEDIQGLNALSAKIIETDGRIGSIPNGNSWKEFRAYRDNQDMGTLWELRQAWYQRQK
ncbi:hypothetical protein BO70DRAFT_381866 [Aspergillus heteromorphus CBS 117.55]|uniref:DEUBAD domain-containing protein n=1 Tax=Aspergillus heteromorphus CBS 117.55 TaxID=1448321 RepID=A0A317VDH9_9EURO|nr:uncharacterized protein BO70DRAFT_381866 [Aspergillus heteromorphus CBS 117.55]PWY72336.1 hypothetical protein BO70DRAFT_381866 [Aspergillus heteromorphus CBS 117.55]